jgi:hypothetical protein
MPDNASFLHAAYAVAAVVYLGYAVALMRRRARVRAALRQAEGGEGR